VEMKADVNWPASVQTVMDKALQRDAELRYASASEFGRDLYAAVAAMPESAATNAFTAVMNKLATPEKASAAIPSSPPSPRASATRTLPPTRVNRASSRDMAAPAPEKPRKSHAMMGVFGMIGFVAIAASMWALGKFGGPGTRSRASETNDAGGSVASQSTNASASITPILDAIKPMTELETGTAETARQALVRLDSLSPPPSDTTEQVYLAFLKASAHFRIAAAAEETGDSTTVATETTLGCDILKRYEGRAQRTGFGTRVNVYLYGDSARQLPPAC